MGQKLSRRKKQEDSAMVKDRASPPLMEGSSAIMSTDHLLCLMWNVPPRVVDNPWVLAYSTTNDGYSLQNLYRKLTNTPGPMLLVVKDLKGRIFGAILPCGIAVSQRFYGTGECKLFTFHPVFKVFQWTGKNDLFVNSTLESISVGADNGRFGLWIDANLNRGRSQKVCTFDNDPLVPDEDFEIGELECWSLDDLK